MSDTPIIDAFKRSNRRVQIQHGLTMTGLARQLEAHCHAFCESDDVRATRQSWLRWKEQLKKLLRA